MGLVTAARDAIAAQNPKPLPHFLSWATREAEPRGLLFSSSSSSPSSCSSSHTKKELRSSLTLSPKIRTRFPYFFYLVWCFTSPSLSVCFPKLFAPNPLAFCTRFQNVTQVHAGHPCGFNRQSAHKYLFVDFVGESDVRKVLIFVGLTYQGPCFFM